MSQKAEPRTLKIDALADAKAQIAQKRRFLKINLKCPLLSFRGPRKASIFSSLGMFFSTYF